MRSQRQSSQIRTLDHKHAEDLMRIFGLATQEILFKVRQSAVGDHDTGWIETRKRVARLGDEARSSILHAAKHAGRITALAQYRAAHLAAEHLRSSGARLPATLSPKPPRWVAGAMLMAYQEIVHQQKHGPINVPGLLAQHLSGRASDGKPVVGLYERAAEATAKAFTDALKNGIAAGKPAALIAQAVTSLLYAGAARFLTIHATETLGAYRDTTTVLGDNIQQVTGWIWIAAPDACPACGAMHGTFHPAGEPLDSHPNCRCIQQMVYGDETPDVESGPERFEKLPEAKQKEILGKKKMALYRDGKITLEDCVTRTHSKDWGPGIREATADEALAHAAGRAKGIFKPGGAEIISHADAPFDPDAID